METNRLGLLIQSYLEESKATADRLPREQIARVIVLLEEARQQGKRVFLFGNGGSAATASHFASDLAKGSIVAGKPRIKAMALTDNLPQITAWANDTAYENVFAEQLDNLLEPGDLVIAISGSGNSPNVLKAVKLARSRKATVIGFTGFQGGKLKELVDVPVIVPSTSMEQVEDFHLLLEHLITSCLRKA